VRERPQLEAEAPPPGGESERSRRGAGGRSAWLEIDWREHQRWVSVDGHVLNTYELGAGPPLVFVHGLSGSWTNWLEQLPVLARAHRVLAFDLPGFGRSPMPAQRITISGCARLLDSLLDRRGIDAAAIVGNSMGGCVATELAIAFPQRVERLVLVSAVGVSTHAPRGGDRLLALMRRYERILASAGGRVAAAAEVLARRGRLREATLGIFVAHPGRLPAPLAAEMLRGAGKPGFVQGLEAVFEYDFRERLTEIVCPTLIVWGAGDRLVSVSDADVFAELIPSSRKIVFADTGHMAMLERPAAFNALLEEFLEE